jgi:hypothetical protein
LTAARRKGGEASQEEVQTGEGHFNTNELRVTYKKDCTNPC